MHRRYSPVSSWNCSCHVMKPSSVCRIWPSLLTAHPRFGVDEPDVVGPRARRGGVRHSPDRFGAARLARGNPSLIHCSMKAIESAGTASGRPACGSSSRPPADRAGRRRTAPRLSTPAPGSNWRRRRAITSALPNTFFTTNWSRRDVSPEGTLRMLHMLLCCNMLVALGGTPTIASVQLRTGLSLPAAHGGLFGPDRRRRAVLHRPRAAHLHEHRTSRGSVAFPRHRRGDDISLPSARSIRH